MAQLKDSTVYGNLSVTNQIFTNTAQFRKIEAPTSSGGSTFGAGNDGQILKSNGAGVYWANLNLTSIAPTVSPNTFFAGPASGNDSGTASWRTLSANDLPSAITTTLAAGNTPSAGSSSADYVPAKLICNTNITVQDGAIITIGLPQNTAMAYNSGIWLSIDNGSNYYPIALQATSSLTTEFSSSNKYTIKYLTLIYETGQKTSVYYTASSSTIGAEAGASTFSWTGGRWRILNCYNTNTTYTTTYIYCGTAASNATKASSYASYFALNRNDIYFPIVMRYTNTAQDALTLNINSTGAKSIYINGIISSSTNYTLPQGSYLVHYHKDANGANEGYYFRTDTLSYDSIFNSIITNIPTAYSNTSTYAVGDKVQYNYKIYKCTTAITGNGENWNASHWQVLPSLQEQIDRVGVSTATSGGVIYATTNSGNKEFTSTDAGSNGKALVYNSNPTWCKVSLGCDFINYTNPTARVTAIKVGFLDTNNFFINDSTSLYSMIYYAPDLTSLESISVINDGAIGLVPISN